MLVLDEVTYRYRSGWQLGPVNAELGPGVTAFVGPNGAGKTTLMQLLAGAVLPRTGRLAWDGFTVARGRALDRWRRRVGHLPQHAQWPGDWSVSDYLDYVALAHGVPRNQVATRRVEALQFTNTHQFADRRLGSLSGGQRQRVHLASAVVHDPRLLILDEPTVGLDPAERVRARSFIRQQGERRLVVVSTHLMDDVALAAHDVWVLNEGRLQWRGGVDELAALAPPGATDVSRAEAGYLTMFES